MPSWTIAMLSGATWQVNASEMNVREGCVVFKNVWVTETGTVEIVTEVVSLAGLMGIRRNPDVPQRTI